MTGPDVAGPGRSETGSGRSEAADPARGPGSDAAGRSEAAGTTQSPVVVFAAMEPEVEPFLDFLTPDGPAPERIGPAWVHHVTVAGRPVMVARTGIGLVNAAASATAVVTALRPAAMVSAGTAGGLAADIAVGDVVVGTAYRFTDADATAFGYAPGQVPGMPERYEISAPWHAALAALTGGADRTAIAGSTVRIGEMVAGDSFVTAANVSPVRARFPAALATDMETTALAQVAHLFDVPFVSVRGVSDLCDPTGVEDHLTHVDDAAERSARVVVELLTHLPV